MRTAARSSTRVNSAVLPIPAGPSDDEDAPMPADGALHGRPLLQMFLFHDNIAKISTRGGWRRWLI
jgi:hypothetical protein